MENQFLRNKIQRPEAEISLPKNKLKNHLSSATTNKTINLHKHTTQTIKNFKYDEFLSNESEGFLSFYWKVSTSKIPNTFEKFSIKKDEKYLDSNFLFSFILENKTETNNIKLTFIIQHKLIQTNKFDKFYKISSKADIKYDLFGSSKTGIFNFKELNEFNKIDEELPNELSKYLMKDNIILFEINIFKQFIRLENTILKFTGIKNEGNSCYINCIIQTLNIINPVKKAILSNLNTDSTKDSMVLESLQKIFYDLMNESKCISALRLVKMNILELEFGLQQDIQEFYLKLLKFIKKKMKGHDQIFKNLFEGKLVNIIECLNINKKVKNEEKFYDIPLTTIGCNNVQESLEKFTEVEILEDLYETEDSGMQKAKKDIKFVKLPKVLVFQLKRFVLNKKTLSYEKNKNCFQYSEEIDLSKFIDSSNIQDTNLNYRYNLHSVIVHNGHFINSGHYYTFIRPHFEDDWLKFNDSNVTPASKIEVYDNNFGGNIKTYSIENKGIRETSKVNESTAYMLIYIENSYREEILSPITLKDIPNILIKKFDTEKSLEILKLETLTNTNENKLCICLISKETIIHHKGFGIFTLYDDENYNRFLESKSERMFINFPINSKFGDLVNYISFNIQSEISTFKIFQVVLDIHSKFLNFYTFKLMELKYDDINLNKKLIEIINNDETIILFIFSNDKIIFDNTPIFNEKYILNKENGESIVLPKQKNSLNFASNFKINIDLSNEVMKGELKIDNLLNKDKIIIFKYFRLNSSIIELLTHKIMCIDSNKRIKDIELNMECIDRYDNNKVNFFLEYTTKNKDSVNSYLEEISPNICFSKFTNKCLIIVVNNISASMNFVENFINQTLIGNKFLRLFCKNENSQVRLSDKLEVSLNIDEKQLKNIILNYLDVKTNFNSLNQDTTYFNENKIEINLKTITENHSLYICKNKNSKFFSSFWIKNFPILEFIDENQIVSYKFNFIKHLLPSNHKSRKFSLYDSNNNFLFKICVFLPNEIIKSKDIINYLFNPILKKFYPDLAKELFYIILQNPNRITIYDIILDKDSHLYSFHGQMKIEYRIQPFYNLGIIKDELKIFIMFNTRDNKYILDPLLLFSKPDEKILSIKSRIHKEMLLINRIKNENQFDDINFYTSVIFEYLPRKELYLGKNTDNDLISEKFDKNHAFNLLVEIPNDFVNNYKIKFT